MINTIILFVLLIATWLILSGFFTSFFITLAIISCAAAIFATKKLTENTLPPTPNITCYIIRLPVYALWMIKEIVISSLHVSYKIWHPKLDINPQDNFVENPFEDDIALTTYANSITLTPGTTALIVKKNRIHVHALDEQDIIHLKDGRMHKKIKRLTRKTNKAC